MLKRQIEQKEAELAALREKGAGFETREAELEAEIGEVDTANSEERSAMEAEIEAFENERSAYSNSVTALENELAELRTRLETEEANAPTNHNERPAAAQNERSMTAMFANINIRSLPMNQRAFDAFPLEQRRAMVEKQENKEFLDRVRSLRSTRGVTGADLLIPVDFLDIISENMYRYSKLLRRLRVRNIRGTARQPVTGIAPEAVWTGRCGNLNELDFLLNQVEIDDFKLAGIIAVCNSDLDDAYLNLASMLIEMLSESLGLGADKAALYGKGPAYQMPLGIVTRLAQTSKPASYPDFAPAWEDLHTSNVITIDASLTGAAFWSALTLATGNTFNRYARGTQFWAMNSKTYTMLKSKAITFTASGDVVSNIFGVLPIINGDIDILEFMPDGDIVGGYGDLYLWGQRAGMTIGMDETGFVNRLKDQTVFFGKMRADGLPVIARAFVAININGSAPTTSMLFAADVANTLAGLIMPAAASVAAGSTIRLKAVGLPYGIDAPVTYTSGTTAKATVDADGVVTGVAAGSSVITATSGSFTATCTVTVTGE
jgi:HK97 family phage major capsid protein